MAELEENGDDRMLCCILLKDLQIKTGVEKDGCFEQFGKKVVDFSSQYGSERSISYTAANLAGKESIYPGYGDFTQACVFRTYGKWWKRTPSTIKNYKRTPDDFCSNDFIEVEFEERVYPSKIEVYETYNPGCIVKILACDSKSGTDVDTGKVEWVTLWKGQPTYPEQEAKIFSPPIKDVKFMSNLIRLEVCQDLIEYYTELDCVKLYGRKPVDVTKCCMPININNFTSVGLHIENLELTTIESSKIESCDSCDNNEYIINGYFSCLPDEVIQLILGYLDLPDLCKLGQSCNLLQKHCYDPLLYTELNLQPYWTQVRDSTLENLMSRCELLQRLNLSWCGKGGILSNTGLESFLPVCSNNLTSIQLSCCLFVDSETLKIISSLCPNIEEIDLSCCRNVDNVAMLLLLRFCKLRRLNLYRTMVDMYSLISVIRLCPLLEHLNLGSCIRVRSFDDVLIEIGKHCKNLISLDLWQARSLTDIGINALGHSCHRLQELDVGWCPQVRSSTNCFEKLLEVCHDLRKLFFTANRTICDNDILAIAKFCPLMEQIDILGTREVTPGAVLTVLEKCKNLVFCDVSFCGGIQDSHVKMWEKQYPNVNFKKSFQN